MGYRDEVVALAGRIKGARQETAQLEQQLDRLRREESELKRQLLRQRFRVIGRLAWRFVQRHLKLVLMLLVVCGSLATCAAQDWLQERRLQRELEARLGAGCSSQLAITATPAGTVALIDGQRLGPVPRTVRLCPGSYRLQLVHPAAVPWQQQLQVAADQRLDLRVDLVSWRIDPTATDRSLIFATPPGTLIFVDGEERGRTPLELRWPAGRPESILLAAHHPGHALFLHRLRPSASLWLHLPAKQEQRP